MPSLSLSPSLWETVKCDFKSLFPEDVFQMWFEPHGLPRNHRRRHDPGRAERFRRDLDSRQLPRPDHAAAAPDRRPHGERHAAQDPTFEPSTGARPGPNPHCALRQHGPPRAGAPPARAHHAATTNAVPRPARSTRATPSRPSWSARTTRWPTPPPSPSPRRPRRPTIPCSSTATPASARPT